MMRTGEALLLALVGGASGVGLHSSENAPAVVLSATDSDAPLSRRRRGGEVVRNHAKCDDKKAVTAATATWGDCKIFFKILF